jgi:rhodanese-related sulfurtransferase
VRSCLRALVFLVAGSAAFALAQDAGSSRLTPISSAELVVLLTGLSPLPVYDVRAEEEFNRAHLPGSTLLPWGNDPAAFIGKLPADKRQPLAFYCNGPT